MPAKLSRCFRGRGNRFAFERTVEPCDAWHEMCGCKHTGPATLPRLTRFMEAPESVPSPRRERIGEGMR